MIRLIKILVDLLTLKEVSDEGKFSWLVMLVGFAAVAVVFGAAMGVAAYYDRHPHAGSGPLIGVLVFAVLILGLTLRWGWCYQNRLAASRKPTA